MRPLLRLSIAALAFALAAAPSLAAPRNPDFADSLSGGPDYWEVYGVGAGDALSARNGPSPRAAQVARFANGTVLRNLGCRLARGQRWCRVEQPGGAALRGWVNGRYLRESGGPR